MADVTKAPVPRAGVRFEELEGEAVVYDRAGKRATYLNDTATIIWKLCDGNRTVPEIVAILAQEYPESAGQIASDVQESIDSLVRERAIVFVEPAPADKTE